MSGPIASIAELIGFAGGAYIAALIYYRALQFRSSGHL